MVEEHGRVIGVELTELYKTSPAYQLPMQVSESLANRIVQKAQTIYEERGGSALWVSVFFGFHSRLDKKRISELASKLADVVSNINIAPDDYVRVENDYLNIKFFPEEIASIQISRRSCITKGLWSVPIATFIPECSSGEVQQAVDKKNLCYPSYRKKCQEAWLLIVHEVSLSSTFKFSDEVLNHIYNSLFERTFLFGNFSPTFVELNGEQEANRA